jgi:hypothetical protein
MLQPIRIVRSPDCGPRNYVLGCRLHHGLVGAAVLAAGVSLHNPALMLAGAALVAHDRHDFPWRPERYGGGALGVRAAT